MQQHTGLFPTDSLPNFLQVELIHRQLKGGFILWVAPIEKLFHPMSNAISLDNQTFSLGIWIRSLTFFRAKIFICFFISLSFPKEYGI